MVARTSQDVQFGGGQTTQIQSSQTGYKQADLGSVQQGSMQGADQGSGILYGLLNTLADKVGKLGAQAVDKTLERAYLDGAQRVGMEEVAGELDTNPLTKDWTNAGYRDTAAKLAMYDAETSMKDKWPELRTKSPEEFGQYLAQRRQKLEQHWEGMSLEQRKAMVGQQALSDKVAMKEYHKAHSEWITATKANAIAIPLKGDLTDLSTLKSNPEAYFAKAKAYYDRINTDVMNNPDFQHVPEIKQKLAFEAVHGAIESDNPAIFAAISTAKDYTGPDGKPSTLFDLFTDEQRYKLQSAARAAKERQDVLLHQDFASKMASIEATIDTNVHQVSPTEYEAMLKGGAQIGYFKSPHEIETRLKDYYVKLHKQVNVNNAAMAWGTGDFNAMATLTGGSVTDKQGYDAWEDQANKMKKPVPQRVTELFQIATKTGSAAAVQGVAELVKSSLGQMRTSDVVTPQAKDLVQQVYGSIQAAEQQGNKAMASQLLGSMSPDDQDFFAILTERMKESKDIGIAIDGARKAIAPENMFVKGDRAAYAGAMAKERIERTTKIAPEGFLAGVGTQIGSIINGLTLGTLKKNSPQYAALNVEGSWFTNDGVLNAKQLAARDRFSYEFGKIASTYRNLSPDVIEQRALAATVAAQLDTGKKSGPLILDPSIPDAHQYFGISDRRVPRDVIGKALGDMVKPPEGQVATFSTSQTGKLSVDYWDKEGRRVGGNVLDPKDVGPYVTAALDAEVNKTKAARGPGVAADAKDAAGNKVVYNGMNNAMVLPEHMLEFRDSLIKAEGVKFESYTLPIKQNDGSVKESKPTNGVGFQNDYYIKPDASGKVTAEQVSKVFTKASDDAAKAAADVQAVVGNKTKESLMLFGHMAYHGGVNFARTSYGQKFLAKYATAVQEPTPFNIQQVGQEFMNTPQYKDAHGARRTMYLQLINQSLRR